MNKKRARSYSSSTIDNLVDNISTAEQEKTDKKMLLATRINETMKNKGLSPMQFAEAIGRTLPEINHWMSGTHDFTIETLWNIEAALDVKLISLDTNENKLIRT